MATLEELDAIIAGKERDQALDERISSLSGVDPEVALQASEAAPIAPVITEEGTRLPGLPPGTQVPGPDEQLLGVARDAALIGGAEAGFQAGAKLPGGPLVKVPGAIAGGLLGATGASVMLDVGQKILNDPDAPADLKQVAENALNAGEDEAVGQMIGLFLRGIPSMFKYLRGSVDPAMLAKHEELKAIGGGGLSIGQIIDDNTTLGGALTGIESILRAAPVGRQPFVSLEEANIASLDQRRKQLLDVVAGSDIDQLTSRQIGSLYKDMIGEGRALHSFLAKDMYKGLDELVPGSTRQVEVPSTFFDAQGNPIKQMTTVQTGPVSLADMNQQVDNIIASQPFQSISGTAESKAFLREVAERSENVGFLSFQDAHLTRGQILRFRRSVPPEQKELLDKALGDLEKTLDRSMEEAAKNSPVPNALETYRAANKFWKFGRETLRSDVSAALLSNKVALENFGESVARTGDQSSFQEVRNAVRGTKVFQRKAAGLDTSALPKARLNPDQIQDSIQAGYMRTITHYDAQTQLPWDSKIMNLFQDERAGRTFRSVLDRDQADALLKFKDELSLTKNLSDARTSRLLEWSQNSVGVKLLSLGTGGTIATGILSASTLIIGPRAMSSVLTNPGLVDLLGKVHRAQWMDTLDPQILGRLTGRFLEKLDDAAAANPDAYPDFVVEEEQPPEELPVQ